MIAIAIVVACGWGVAVLAQAGGLYFETSEGHALRRQAAITFLNALHATYIVVLIAVLPTTAVLAVAAAWSRRRHLRERLTHARPASTISARLLLCAVSVVASLLLLESGAAVWRAWLHRSPRLPEVQVQPDANRVDADGAVAEGRLPHLPTEFPMQSHQPASGAGPLKILVIGESSARRAVLPVVVGRPDRWLAPPARFSPSADRGRQLGARRGNHRAHAQPSGWSEISSRRAVVYVGHNEFQARYAWMRDVDYYLDDDISPRTPRLRLSSSIDRFSPLCRLIEEARERQRLDTIPPRTVTRELVDRPVCTAAETAAIVADFRARLAAIVVYCEQLGTLPILVIPPGNDAGYDPSRSILAPETPKSERVKFAHAVARCAPWRSATGPRRLACSARLRSNIPSSPKRTIAWRGCWHRRGPGMKPGDITPWRECDALPLRCPEPLRQVYRDVAAAHRTALLVDGPSVLEAMSPHGIVGDQFFHDAQHPNLAGYAALAQEILRQLRMRRAFGFPESSPLPVVDVELCARHFKIDAPRWAEICRREIWFFHASAYIRYDPKFRIARAGDYERAADAIRSGIDPADAGMPGWALPPKPAKIHRLSPRLTRK